MNPKVSMQVLFDPQIAAKIDSAILEKQFGKVERVTRASFIRQLVEDHLADRPVPTFRSRNRATVAPDAV